MQAASLFDGPLSSSAGAKRSPLKKKIPRTPLLDNAAKWQLISEFMSLFPDNAFLNLGKEHGFPRIASSVCKKLQIWDSMVPRCDAELYWVHDKRRFFPSVELLG